MSAKPKMQTTRRVFRVIWISIRSRGGDCYVARGQLWNVTASSTSSPAIAAERVALKIKLGAKDVCNLRAADQGITLSQLSETEFKAEWPLEGSA